MLSRKQKIIIWVTAALLIQGIGMLILHVILSEKTVKLVAQQSIVMSLETLKNGDSTVSRNEKSSKKSRDNVTNIVIFGMDQEKLRSDVIILCSLNTTRNKVTLISVPRDTRIKLNEAMYTEFQRKYPVNRFVKVNAIHNYAGRQKGGQYALIALQELLGLSIDNYIKVNIESFRKIVDLVGGVEMDIPQDMVHSDIDQDLFINIKKGKQRLNGVQAEHAVRYRADYFHGDLDRINFQQKFMKAFLKELLKVSNFLKINEFIRIVYENVETDLKFADFMRFITYLPWLKSENIRMKILPGGGKYIDGVSYFIFDRQAFLKMKEVLGGSDEPY